MFEAEFTHEGDRCTLEVLIERIGLNDPALIPIAEIVHDIDLKDSKFGRQETPGIEQLIAGIRSVASGDALLAPSVTRRVIEEFVRRPPASVRALPAKLEDLTARELEVLKLVARGLSNAEIATELFVSDTTVKTHVAHVLTKLDLRDRVQAVVLAYESGLVQPGET